MAWSMALLGASVPSSAAGFELLETITTSTIVGSVTFSGLDAYSNYKHLQLRITAGHYQTGTGGSAASLRLNGDSSGGNYTYQVISGSGSDPTSYRAVGYNSMYIYGIPKDAGSASGFNASIIDILDFASTVKNTTARAVSGYYDDGSGQIMFSSGLWRSTNAVTSLELDGTFNGVGSFAANSRFSLYGVK